MVYLTVRDVSQQLRVSEAAVREWLRSGRLRGVKPGGKGGPYRIAPAWLAAFIDGDTAGSRQDAQETTSAIGTTS